VYVGRRAVIATIQGIAAEDICSDDDVNTEVKPEPHNDLGRRAVIATIQGIAADDICSDDDVNTEVKPEPHNDVPTMLAEKTLIKRRWLIIW